MVGEGSGNEAPAESGSVVALTNNNTSNSTSTSSTTTTISTSTSNSTAKRALDVGVGAISKSRSTGAGAGAGAGTGAGTGTGTGAVGDRAKRVRVSRACDQCRAGREKCDGAQPICHTCDTQSRACTYHEQPKKRGIQPNYIRTLELTLAWLFQQFPETRHHLSQLLPKSNEPAHRLISFKDAPAADALHVAWRNGIISRQIDQLLSGADIEIPKTDSSLAAPPRIQTSEPTYQSPPLSAPSEPGVLLSDGHATTTRIDNALPSGYDSHEDGGTSETLVLPQNSWALLEHYFAFTQTWLPITEKHDMLRLMYSYPAAGLSRREATGAEHAELWSIMAWSALCTGAASGIGSEMCHSIAKSLIPSDTGIGFQLGHIKALLILSMIELVKGSILTSWLVVGTAVRLLLHFTGGQATDFVLTDGRMKHTLLAAFLLEKAVAIHSGAQTHMSSEHIKAYGLLVEDGLEEWQPWHDPTASLTSAATKTPARSISTFNALIQLAMQPPPATGVAIVYDMLRNASATSKRMHPADVLIHRQTQPTTTLTSTGRGSSHSSTTPTARHVRTSSSHLEQWSPRASSSGNAFTEHQYPFMTIPTANSESATGSTPAQANSGATPTQWVGAAPQGVQKDLFGNALPGQDIFEELAMLERADSSHNPNFMQNLGFGPDLDLAEFFGPDYQPSDPLLAYVQPNHVDDLAEDFDVSSSGAG